MRHVHNLWLETMAESGFRRRDAAGVLHRALGGADRLWRRGPGCDARRGRRVARRGAAVFVAGMNFYMVKQNFGMLTLLVWAYALVWAAAAWDRPPSPNEFDRHPRPLV